MNTPTMIRIISLSGRLTRHQRLSVELLSHECFKKVPQQGIDEDFIARARGHVMA